MDHLLEQLFESRRTFHDLFTIERGATATEYSLLVAFIALAVVARVGAVGLALNGKYSDLEVI